MKFNFLAFLLMIGLAVSSTSCAKKAPSSLNWTMPTLIYLKEIRI